MTDAARRETSPHRVRTSGSTGRVAVALVLAMLGLLTGCTSTVTPQDIPQAEKTLSTFTGPDFSVLLPGEPDQTTRTVSTAAGDQQLVFYTVVSKDAAISVAVTTYPNGVPVDLDGAVNGAAGNIGGTVLSSAPITIGADEGRDGRIGSSRDGVNLAVYFRMVLSGQRLVQIQQVVTGAELGSPPSNYQQIVESLVLS
ncbi:hypothetical protein ABLG96_08930 [Nakamurella sp. A5-74]|uniref:Lipoprotein n=1 Tax=Nakamurella sp. A5-74 TaxID=3158264 RepID=A0AAU8DUV4_9ACTN